MSDIEPKKKKKRSAPPAWQTFLAPVSEVYLYSDDDLSTLQERLLALDEDGDEDAMLGSSYYSVQEMDEDHTWIVVRRVWRASDYQSTYVDVDVTKVTFQENPMGTQVHLLVVPEAGGFGLGISLVVVSVVLAPVLTSLDFLAGAVTVTWIVFAIMFGIGVTMLWAFVQYRNRMQRHVQQALFPDESKAKRDEA